MPFKIVRQDITKLKVDAIVNAANTKLLMGGGVCGAIFSAAGASALQAACDKLSPIKTGDAVATPAFSLKARCIIHAAGPVYDKNNRVESEKLLHITYMNALKIAVEQDCNSVAFPLISSGIYGFPKDGALRVAIGAIQSFLAEHDMDVILAVFDKASFQVSSTLLGAVEGYIDEHYVDENRDKRRVFIKAEHDELSEPCENARVPQRAACLIPSSIKPLDLATVIPLSVENAVAKLDIPFSQALLNIIDSKGKTDVEVYKRANIDRKLFSKIRNVKGYMPSKRTAVALAIALELSLDETEGLLQRAGYALSPSVKFDVIVEYFIVSGNYDIYEINQVLFEYDQPLLGC